MLGLAETLEPQRAAVALIGCNEGDLSAAFPQISIALPAMPRMNGAQSSISIIEDPIYWFFSQRFFSKLERLVPQIEDFAAKNQISHIVSVLDHPSVIWLTKRLSSALGIKFSTFLSDVPEAALHRLGYDARSKALVMKEFIDLLRTAQVAAFASKEMTEFYEKFHAIKGKTLLVPVKNHIGTANYTSRGITRIGCILDHRYQQSVKDLVTACQQNLWKAAGTEVQLRLVGSASGISFYFEGKPAEIEILGGLSEEETVAALCDCTFNYLPYTTDQQLSLSARLCLPDDLPLYLEAQRPLLSNSIEPSLIAAKISEFSLGQSIPHCTQDSFAQSAVKLAKMPTGDEIKRCAERAKEACFGQASLITSLHSMNLDEFMKGS